MLEEIEPRIIGLTGKREWDPALHFFQHKRREWKERGGQEENWVTF